MKKSPGLSTSTAAALIFLALDREEYRSHLAPGFGLNPLVLKPNIDRCDPMEDVFTESDIATDGGRKEPIPLNNLLKGLLSRFTPPQEKED